MAEMLVRLVWTYMYKNVRSFGSPKRYLYKIRGKDTTFSPIMQTLFYNFAFFYQKTSFFTPFVPQNVSNSSRTHTIIAHKKAVFRIWDYRFKLALGGMRIPLCRGDRPPYPEASVALNEATYMPSRTLR